MQPKSGLTRQFAALSSYCYVHKEVDTVEARVRSLVHPCRICDGQSDTRTGRSPSLFRCQYVSTSNLTGAPYSCLFHLGDVQWARS